MNNYKLLIFDEIDSTNLEAIRIAKTNPSLNYAILAKTQTQGRTRKGKKWQSLLGNLHTSLLLKPNKELTLFPQLSFVTGLAVYETIESLIFQCHSRENGNPGKASGHPEFISGSINNKMLKQVQHDEPDSCLCGNDIKERKNDIGEENNIKNIKLKWPNDILINDKKISGILLESLTVANNNYLIVGVGINIVRNPLNIDQLTTSLSAENMEIHRPEALLDIFIVNFEKYYQIWEQKGFIEIRKIWLEKAYKLNESVTINDGNNTITGIFKGIDEVGRIIIQLPTKKISSFTAGELSF
ncbi:biotin--[acetyl-CoA-carboxylase] ligase [Rickettsia endosymbiont of Orchestes rusci]|uniref:biotin--[acetyl-CoA-carboxylase] ligase n=1 Tax=Rickettsia endosymbiont of Orchestes rusci TaxID=3066250 RepID=UPI00313CEEA7